ncbi:sulfurtransferase [Mucilaginibacter terrae]|uniref:sulfurtransferase n=1 Tax=Mucilaginibacter terrae TaxID=1955052 RepID=UPI003629BE16
MLPLIEAEELKQLDKSTYTLIDTRGFGNSREHYEQGHLEGALYVDLEDLAAHPEDAANGGRHPLPELKDFAALLGRLGITPQTHVIVYDDKAAANPAARFWWMMKAIGHPLIQVLNGGLQAAVIAGIYPVTGFHSPLQPAVYPIPANYANTVTITEVDRAVKNRGQIVIDVREKPRYLGQTEPIDLIAGHIPGAINVPYLTNLGAGNRYLNANELKEQYQEIFGDVKPEQVIVHCGSGVTACHTLLALEQAGLTGAKLYVGSWSEWSRRDLPVATDEK